MAEKPKMPKDLGLPGKVWKVYNVYDFVKRAVGGNVPTP
jgi:hypothetical protein